MKKFFRIIKGEFKEIKWPSPKNTVKQTAFTMAIIVIFGGVFMAYDLGLEYLLRLIMV